MSFQVAAGGAGQLSLLYQGTSCALQLCLIL